MLPLVLCALPSLLLMLPVGIVSDDRFVVAIVEDFVFVFGDAKIDDEVVVVVLVADDRDDDAVDVVAIVDFDLNESHSEKVDEGFEKEEVPPPSAGGTNASGTATTTSTFSCI